MSAPDPRPREAQESRPRRWVIEFPAGLELLNANRQKHWRPRARVTAMLRETGGWLARIQKVPRLERARIDAYYEPPDRRKRDPSNWFPSYKAAIDGITDAGVFADDDAAHVDGPHMDIGPLCPKGRIVLVITELTAGES